MGTQSQNEIKTEESLRLVNMTGFFEDKMIIPQRSSRLPQTKSGGPGKGVMVLLEKGMSTNR
jgi:hypothetical protein